MNGWPCIGLARRTHSRLESTNTLATMWCRYMSQQLCDMVLPHTCATVLTDFHCFAHRLQQAAPAKAAATPDPKAAPVKAAPEAAPKTGPKPAAPAKPEAGPKPNTPAAKPATPAAPAKGQEAAAGRTAAAGAKTTTATTPAGQGARPGIGKFEFIEPDRPTVGRRWVQLDAQSLAALSSCPCSAC
jgi:hypothetical protein